MRWWHSPEGPTPSVIGSAPSETLGVLPMTQLKWGQSWNQLNKVCMLAKFQNLEQKRSGMGQLMFCPMFWKTTKYSKIYEAATCIHTTGVTFWVFPMKLGVLRMTLRALPMSLGAWSIRSVIGSTPVEHYLRMKYWTQVTTECIDALVTLPKH